MNALDERRYSVESFKIKYMAKTPPPKKDVLNSPRRVVSMSTAIFNELDGGSSVEHFGAIFLNSQNEMIGFKAFNTGTVDQVAVYPRMIIHTGLMVGASGIILVHNHPSGYTNPSEEDRRLTRTLKEAARLFDIRILDHLVTNENGDHFSFLEQGLL